MACQKIERRFLFDKIFIKNIFSLGSIQLMNYLFPLITFPYLVRVLGVEKFGLVNFAAAFIGYFSMIVDYGFNISAVRLVSINRNDKKKVSELILSIYIIKFVLFFISLIIFFAISLAVEKFRNEFFLYVFTFLTVIGNLFLPFWFFQGIEKPKYIALVTFIIRLIGVISIFLLIKNSDDYKLTALINSVQSLLIGLILFFILIYEFKIKIKMPQVSILKEQIKDGGMIFISTCSISLYTISNTFILGLLTSNAIVGYFTAADKIRLAIQNLISPITQAMYPHVAKLFDESKSMAKKFVMKALKVVGGFSLLISLLTFLFAEHIIFLVVGKDYQQSIIVLRIISFLPFIIYLSNLFGIQTMLNMKYNKEFTAIISFAAVINLVLSFLLIPYLNEIGSAISVLITEIMVASLIIIFLSKNKFFKINEI